MTTLTSPTYFYPTNGQVLANAPYNAAPSMATVSETFDPCGTPTNKSVTTRKATITGFTSTTVFAVRRFNYTCNGVSIVQEINLDIAASTSTADIAELRNRIINDTQSHPQIGLKGCLVGGGQNLTIAVVSGTLEVSISSTSDFVPVSLIVGGSTISFV